MKRLPAWWRRAMLGGTLGGSRPGRLAAALAEH